MTAIVPPDLDVQVVQSFYSIKVYLAGALHLCVKRRNLVGFQAWREDRASCSIEFTYASGAKITTEYDDVTKFMRVLSALDAVVK